MNIFCYEPLLKKIHNDCSISLHDSTYRESSEEGKTKNNTTKIVLQEQFRNSTYRTKIENYFSQKNHRTARTTYYSNKRYKSKKKESTYHTGNNMIRGRNEVQINKNPSLKVRKNILLYTIWIKYTRSKNTDHLLARSIRNY